jgi:hypothetical protein
MGYRPRRAYRRALVRRLRETRGQTTVEWLVAMVAVLALAAGLVAALPGTAGAIVDQFGCLVGAAVGRGCDDATSDGTSGSGSAGVHAQETFGDGPAILHVGEGSDWVPQGLGYDPATDQLLTTYYSSPDGDPDRDAGILLSIQDRGTGI